MKRNLILLATLFLFSCAGKKGAEHPVMPTLYSQSYKYDGYVLDGWIMCDVSRRTKDCILNIETELTDPRRLKVKGLAANTIQVIVDMVDEMGSFGILDYDLAIPLSIEDAELSNELFIEAATLPQQNLKDSKSVDEFKVLFLNSSFAKKLNQLLSPYNFSIKKLDHIREIKLQSNASGARVPTNAEFTLHIGQ